MCIQARRFDGRSLWHIWGIGEVHSESWWENLKERDHIEDLGVEQRIM